MSTIFMNVNKVSERSKSVGFIVIFMGFLWGFLWSELGFAYIGYVVWQICVYQFVHDGP